MAARSVQFLGIGFIFFTMVILFYLAQKVYREYRRNKSKPSLAFTITFISWAFALTFLGLERISLVSNPSIENQLAIVLAQVAIVFSLIAVLGLDLFASLIGFPKYVKKLMIIPVIFTIIFLVLFFYVGGIKIHDSSFEIDFEPLQRSSVLWFILPIFLYPIIVLAYYINSIRSRSTPHAVRAVWVVVATSIVLFTYTLEVIGDPDIINYVRSLYVVAALIFYFCFTHFTELQWPEKIYRLYFCLSDGACLYDHSFKKDKSSDLSASLVTGFISGIISLIQEITQSNKHLKVIDVEDIKIMLEYGNYGLITIMVSEESYRIIRNKMKKSIQEFEMKFKEDLAKFVGTINKYSAAKEIVDKIFSYKEQF